MKKMTLTALTLTVLASLSLNTMAAEVCKVSMMGRVCFDDAAGDAATAAHMKGDAVAEAAKKDAGAKKLADNAAK
ncbi:MAG TPA: hypothetical protein VGJ90_05085 [Methylophilaceae bacterium]|jgi:hypothetical protein